MPNTKGVFGKKAFMALIYGVSSLIHRCQLKEYFPLLEWFLTTIGEVVTQKSWLETTPTLDETLKLTFMGFRSSTQRIRLMSKCTINRQLNASKYFAGRAPRLRATIEVMWRGTQTPHYNMGRFRRKN